MRDINRVLLLGRLGMDPELKKSQNDISYTTFNLATENYIKSKNESETTWHRVVVWGKTAEYCTKYLRKGSPTFIEGKFKTRKYEDKEGTTHYMHEVHAERVTIMQQKVVTAPTAYEADADPEQVQISLMS